MGSRTAVSGWKGLLALGAFASLAAGCGSISGAAQDCSSSGGLFEDSTVTCSGSIDSLSGSIGVEFGDDDEFENTSSGTQRLRGTFTARSGTAALTAPGPDGDVTLGTLRAGETLRVDETVAFADDDNSINFDAGEDGELGGVEYEATATPLR